MKKIGAIVMVVSLLLAACGQSEQEQVDKGKRENKLVQKETKVKQPVVNYKASTKKQLNAYMKALPSAFNDHNYTLIKPYIAVRSEAEKYIKKNMAAGQFDHYYIKNYSINKVSQSGKQATVTRYMSSKATNQQLMKVVTIFDLKYDKTKKKMVITDFNDQSVTAAAESAQPASEKETADQPSTEKPATGDAKKCIMSNFATDCTGLTQEELMTAYNELVAAKELPKAPATDCIQCAVQESLDIKNGKKDTTETPKSAITAQQALSMVEAQYRKPVEEYNDEAKVGFVLATSQLEEDISGKYYVVKAVDENLTEANFLQSFKVYIDSGEIVAE